MSVLRFLFHEGLLQPDDLLDQHHAGADVRLLGEFTFRLLLLRIEETAIGAVIGIAAAMLVLPINTRTHIRHDAHTFFLTLSELVDDSVASLLGTSASPALTETARQLGRDLLLFRITAKPLSAGIAGMAGRRTMRHGLRMLTACDRYARILVRSSETPSMSRRTSPTRSFRPPTRFAATSTC